MKFFLKLYKSSGFWPILIVVVAGILASRTLLFQKGYFNMHDDLQMMRQLEMEKCFLDGQIPCRWVPDMGYGFGFPLFNYYPPLPYLIGEIFRIVGFSFINTVKITFAFSFIVSGITMYLLVKEFFGKLGGILASVFYIWAPYHAVDVYVRGAMNEAWALAWFPLILYLGYKLITEKKEIIKWVLGLSLAWFALFTSHNLMVLIFTPVFSIWCVVHIWKNSGWKRIPALVVSGIFSFGLSAFFTLPVILETKLVQANSLVEGYYEYIAHFADINQLLFSRFWGYGPSVWMEMDKMSFQVGHLHWILSLVILALVLINRKSYILILFFIAVGWFSAFMAHSRSTFIWQAIPFLKYVQFPWRFLTIAIFSFSFVIGSLPQFIFDKQIQKRVTAILITALLLLNWKYFLPEGGKLGSLTDKQKFSAAAWELQQTAGIYDYLPKFAKEAPKAPRKDLVEILDGEAIISGDVYGTNWAKFRAGVNSETSLLRIGIFKFPEWKVFIDGELAEPFVPQEEVWGRMHIVLNNGEHEVMLRLYNTWPRKVGNIISLVSWAGLIFLLVSYKKWPVFLEKIFG
ncbi:MAG: hypothetical protein AAB685_01340 [Patescibacteria group bacterium]